MFDALNDGCVLVGGDGCLGGACDVDGYARLGGVCGGDVCLSGVSDGDDCLGGICGGVGDVCVVIGDMMGFCGDVVGMSRLHCGLCLCGSGVGGCWDGGVVFCGGEVILVCSVLFWLVSVVLLVEFCCYLCLWVLLSDRGEGVSCILVGFCFGVFVSLLGDRGVSNVNMFCVGVTVVWCVGALSNLAYVCLEVMVAVVHVELPGCVSVVFSVCLERESVWWFFVCVCRGCARYVRLEVVGVAVGDF